MDSDLHMQLDLPNRLPVVNDGIPPQLLSESLFQSTLCQLNNQDDSIIGLPIFQGEPLKDLNEHCLGSTTLDPGSLGTLASRNYLNMLSSGCPYTSSSSVPTSINCGYDDVIIGDVNGKWDQNRFPMQPELSWRTSTPGLQPLQIRPCLDCSSDRNKELSLLGFASNSNPPQFSEIIGGSRYLGVLQQILSDIASFSLTSIDQANFTDGLVSSSSKLVFSSHHLNDPGICFKHTSEFCDDDGSFDPVENSYRRQQVELKKSQLLALLQVVDDCYNRCLDEVHTVISAFHAATELDPQVHACFPLRTISFFYINLRGRIINEILAMGMNSGSTRDNGRSLETCFVRKQWALQQLKRKDQQLWRPQRGLPERSVSVLRAWMFDNFLHPYPKDAEKHLLAVKSGLTRSQVSNWFINARVRLWKPLVEEMCAELNQRKGGRQNDEVTNNNNNNNHRSHLSIYECNQRFNT